MGTYPACPTIPPAQGIPAIPMQVYELQQQQQQEQVSDTVPLLAREAGAQKEKGAADGSEECSARQVAGNHQV